MNIATATKQALSEVIGRAVEYQTVLEAAPLAQAELARREEEAAQAKRENARLERLAELRKAEEAAAVALAAKCGELRGLLDDLHRIRADVRHAGGAPIVGSVAPNLAAALESHLRIVGRNHPQWIGLPRLKTRQELAVEDAKLQLENAEERLVVARELKKSNKDYVSARDSIVERAENSVKVAKARLADAKSGGG